jgi:serine-type D-Ala-D-Ala carboxypeptidase (penicillin-binding protein 5/6)
VKRIAILSARESKSMTIPLPSTTSHSCSRRRFLQAGGLGLFSLWSDRVGAQTPAPNPLPTLRDADRIDGPPMVSARAWAIADGRTGHFLWGANESAELLMASTTKIMTAHLVLREAAAGCGVLNEMMAISTRAAQTIGSSAQIRAGDRLTVGELLYGLLLPSGNDAAAAMAEHFGPRFAQRRERNPDPPLDAFVNQMNRQAATHRLAETRYFDPHGLGRNHTSARDLTKLAWHAMQDPVFRSCVRTRRHQCEIADAQGARRTVTWNNTNRLLDIEGFDGIKTGTTTAAGSCLVASGRHGSDDLYVAVLGCTSNDSRYVDTRNLFRWAWRERGHRS